MLLEYNLPVGQVVLWCWLLLICFFVTLSQLVIIYSRHL